MSITVNVADVSPRRILQARSPNVTHVRPRSTTPVTPTKARHPLDTPIMFSSVLSPTTSLAQRYAHLEDSHTSLKGEYESLHAKYSEDLKHWKEWKAVEVVRIELKKKKKEERRAKASASGSTKASSQSKLVCASEESQPKELVVRQRGTSATVESEHEEERDFVEEEEAPQSVWSEGVEHPGRPASQAKPFRGLVGDVTPRPRQICTDRTTHASRITPWLGGPTVSCKTPRRKEPDPIDDTDVFEHPLPTASAKVQTPLIRDRLGSTTSSLRKAALRKTIRADPSRASPATSLQTPKRQLDLENISIAEKSARLKQLSKMPATEKRQLYAQYKGKGRYLPPENM